MNNKFFRTIFLTAILCMSDCLAIKCNSQTGTTIEDCGSLNNATYVEYLEYCAILSVNETVEEQGCLKSIGVKHCNYNAFGVAFCCCSTDLCNANSDQCKLSQISSDGQPFTGLTTTTKQQPIVATTKNQQPIGATTKNQQPLVTTTTTKAHGTSTTTKSSSKSIRVRTASLATAFNILIPLLILRLMTAGQLCD